MRTYTVHDNITGTYHDPMLGEINFAFDAGDVVPASEQEELVLEDHLIPAGLAEAVGADERRYLSAGKSDDERAGGADQDPGAAGEAVDTPDGAAAPGVPDGFPEHATVEAVMAWAGADPERAQEALTLEEHRTRPRHGLIDHLAELVAQEG